jgi:hypothetical protein
LQLLSPSKAQVPALIILHRYNAHRACANHLSFLCQHTPSRDVGTLADQHSSRLSHDHVLS